jgi:DNA polymerase sigma
VQQKQLEDMTTEQIEARIQHNQHENKKLIEQLANRAAVQEYTEQQYEELRTLLQEALLFLEEVPLTSETLERQGKLMSKIRKKL